MIDQVQDRGMDTFLGEDVVIVEHQHHRVVDVVQLVDQHRDDPAHRLHPGRTQGLIGACHQLRVNRPQRGNDVAPENWSVVITRLQTQERKRPLLHLRVMPRGQ